MLVMVKFMVKLSIYLVVNELNTIVFLIVQLSISRDLICIEVLPLALSNLDNVSQYLLL